jgi:hypothetical protein
VTAVQIVAVLVRITAVADVNVAGSPSCNQLAAGPK